MKNKALIVIDMQKDFCTGSLANPDAVAIIPKIVEKLEEAKEDKDIFFTKDTHYPDYLDTAEGKKLPVEHCIKGTDGWAIVDEFIPYLTKETRIIEKPTFGYEYWRMEFDGFYDEIEVCGLTTNICVISNAIILRSLYPNTRIVIDSNCCAGTTKEEHEAALLVAKSCQIDVI